MAQNNRRCRKRTKAGCTSLAFRIKGESKNEQKRQLKVNRRRVLFGDIRYSHYASDY